MMSKTGGCDRSPNASAQRSTPFALTIFSPIPLYYLEGQIMVLRVALAVALLSSLGAFAQQPGPALSIDAAANVHPISPNVYGINFYWDLTTATPQTAAQTAALMAAALELRPTVRRWGGNSTSTYHWMFDVDNLDNDWFFEVLPDATVNAAALPAGSTFNQ